MHIFFVNTSKSELDEYSDLFEMERERRGIISLSCPFSSWKKGGFDQCALKIGECIDSYKDVSGEYALVVYVDLMDFPEYASETGDKETVAYSTVMMKMITHYVEQTLYQKLDLGGRKPKHAVILFDQKPIPANALKGDQRNKLLGEKVLALWGFPTENEYEALVTVAEQTLVDTEKETIERFYEAERALRDPEKELLEGLADLYDDQICTVLEALAATDRTTIKDIAVEASNNVVYIAGSANISNVTLCSNRFAGGENTKENARRFLRLYAYLIDCANNGTHISVEGGGEEAKPVPELSDATLQKVCDALYEKQRHYYALYLETKNTKEKYSELGLVPALYKLNCGKFGLNEMGNPAKKVLVSREAAEPSEKEAGQDEKDQNGVSAQVKVGSGTRLKVGSERREVLSVFDPGEFEHFDSYGDQIAHLVDEDEELSSQKGDEESKKSKKEKRRARNKRRSGSPEEIGMRYDADAMQIRQNHTDYLENLSRHLNSIHSHYASNSEGNKPAILKKRIYESESFFADEKQQRERRYAVKATESPEQSRKYGAHGQKESAESQNSSGDKYALETEDEMNVQNLAQNAYNTVQQEYLQFCAGRTVALSDIDEQCSWFKTRLEQIQKSLEKIGTVGLGLFLAMIVVFLPFVLVQWTAITENALTVAVAAGSFAIPLVILYVIYTVVSLRQKREFEKAWKEFKEKSRQALEDNAEAVKQYDRLLSALIPSLRWVYEYKLDVEQYIDCCRLAKAKRKHHEDKLFERSEAVGNLLEDLEYDAKRKNRPNVDKKLIDYSKAYSVGDKNTKLYSVLDQELLEIIMEGRAK